MTTDELVYEEVNEFKKNKRSTFKSMINLKELSQEDMDDIFAGME